VSKPIIIIYVPEKIASTPQQLDQIRLTATALTGGEYFVFVVPTREKEFLFEGLYPQDFDEVKYFKLEEKLRKNLETQ